jgi:hypothetical protein
MEYTIYVDSNNRDSSLYPNSNNYTLFLTTPIKNISKVELLTGMVPALASSSFLTLDILELRTPRNLIADRLVKSTSNIMAPSSNAFYGSFATIPIKVSASDDFYNANYRISMEYPSLIDKLERLTVTWRQPNNGSIFVNSDNTDMGRNMFLLRFVTVLVPEEPERADSLPEPVKWEGTRGKEYKLYVVFAAAFIGIFIILSIKNRKT